MNNALSDDRLAWFAALDKNTDVPYHYIVAMASELLNRRTIEKSTPPMKMRLDWVRAIQEACDLAMKKFEEAPIPESADFGQIAQGLSCVLGEIKDNLRTPYACQTCGSEANEVDELLNAEGAIVRLEEVRVSQDRKIATYQKMIDKAAYLIKAFEAQCSTGEYVRDIYEWKSMLEGIKKDKKQ